MNRLMNDTSRSARVARCFVAGVAALSGIALGACSVDRALAVSDVDVATVDNLNSAAGLPVLYGGGLSDFQQALTGTDAAITMPGLLTDELRDIDTFPTRIEVDQRNTQLTNGTVQTWYRQMHKARASLERAITAFGKFGPTDTRLAESHAVDGFVYAMFAEDFCNGVPYSTFSGAAIYGGPNSGMSSLKIAVSQFDSALALAPSGTNHYLAEIGKARALLDMNQPAQAAAAVADVPVTFQYLVYNSTNTPNEQSGLYTNIGPPSKRFAIADNDGKNGLFFRTEGQDSSSKTNPTKAGDTRVRYYLLGNGQDGKSPAYYELKSPDYTAKVVLADGIEAQLIIAEAQLAAGNPAWLATLNALRGNSTLLNTAPYTNIGQSAGKTLPALVDPGTKSAQVDMLFHERAFWMFLTGHRLGDMRRLVWQYGRDAETVFPTGTYQGAAGGLIGKDTNFPITVDENNNPKASACTDRSANFGT
ncbi:MAG: rane or secreted protein [Gemmatimonadetes bacterium]|nr:rane or secreted protein [Gemmatimonadota bacterium]